VQTNKENPNRRRKESNKMTEETGTTRHIDYVKFDTAPNIGGPTSLLKHLSNHEEFNEKSMCLAFFSDNNKLEHVWWFKGQQTFPQKWLTKKLTNSNVCVVYCNLEAEDNTLKQIAGMMCSEIDPDDHPFWLDALVLDVEDNTLFSLMCEGNPEEDCETCSIPLSTHLGNVKEVNTTEPYKEDEDFSLDEVFAQLEEKYKEEN
jgi:hypothetical protein